MNFNIYNFSKILLFWKIRDKKEEFLVYRKALKKFDLLSVLGHPDERHIYQAWLESHESSGNEVIEFLRVITDTKNFDVFDIRRAIIPIKNNLDKFTLFRSENSKTEEKGQRSIK